MVFSGFKTACLLARGPTSLSPVFLNPTTDGVVLPPSALMIIAGFPPSITATAEFVVPRSIPTLLAIQKPPFLNLEEHFKNLGF
ncbi:MAG: hypothetical protein MOIL_01448 [Candidatus Methanolliviera sp. GoM_oil]|nr:MAG: hypothetical protein MOIL_01448 [Candidatus Methanolliviera sp. GoM_oil]